LLASGQLFHFPFATTTVGVHAFSKSGNRHQKSSKSFSRLTASDAAVVDSDYSVFILESDFLH
jgi:hypothetical protein